MLVTGIAFEETGKNHANPVSGYMEENIFRILFEATFCVGVFFAMISVGFTCTRAKLSFRTCVWNHSNICLSAVCRLTQWWWWELWTYCASTGDSNDADDDVSGVCGYVSKHHDGKGQRLVRSSASRRQNGRSERGKRTAGGPDKTRFIAEIWVCILSTTVIRTTLVPAHRPGSKRLEREAGHTPPYSAKVNNGWSFTYSSIRLHGLTDVTSLLTF
jgi:hypothetical protein